VRILYVAPTFSLPLFSGDALRHYNLIKQLGSRHDIWLLSIVHSKEQLHFVSEMRKYCTYVDVVKQDGNFNAIERLRYLLSTKPYFVNRYFHQEMAEKIKDLLSKVTFDIVQLEHNCMAEYLRAIPRQTSSVTILTVHDIGVHLYMRRVKVSSNFAEKVGFLLSALQSHFYDRRMNRCFNKIITVSEFNKRYLCRTQPHLDVSVIPNGVDLESYTPNQLDESPSARRLVFTGLMSHKPNEDAMIFFTEEIYPTILDRLPDCELWIVGANPSSKIKALGTQNSIIVRSNVPDIKPYILGATVYVVPIRFGGGTRLKILEAMALKKPVISTSIGAEGLDVSPGGNIIIANEKHDFATQTIRVLEDKKLRSQIAEAGKKLVESKYDWKIVASKLDRLWRSSRTKSC